MSSAHRFQSLRAAAAALIAPFALAACAGHTPPSPFQDEGRVTPQKIAPRPDYPGYAAAVASQDVPWTVESLLDDFMELSFETEWGTSHRSLLKWPQKARIKLTGSELGAYRPDLDALLDIVRAGAPPLDLTLVLADEEAILIPPAPYRATERQIEDQLRLDAVSRPFRPFGERADITIRTAPRAEMRAVADTALCFFAPVDLTWEGYKEADARGEVGWEDIEQLEAITIFIPEHAAPHVFRICFVEEIMQALGPGNDLYRLEDSGFNDDEVHVAPTAFDLLMLRVLYDPTMRPGMSRLEARRAARGVLSRLVGDDVARVARSRSDADEEFQLYHYFSDVRSDPAERRELLTLANEAAAKMDQRDHRVGEALRSEAYFASERDRSALAVAYARRAVEHFQRTLPAGSARLARTRADLGLFLLLNRDYAEAAEVLASAEPWLAAHGKEDDLATSLRLRAIALAQLGDYDDAAEVARDALDWAAYVFGADSDALSDWRKQFRDFDIAV
ncbi:MAG: DUF2927 domain-containing protein [Pseudomonadota bacterium]